MLVAGVVVALVADAVALALARGPEDDVEADEDFDAGPSEEQPRTIDRPRTSIARMRGSKDGAAPAASPMSTTPRCTRWCAIRVRAILSGSRAPPPTRTIDHRGVAAWSLGSLARRGNVERAGSWATSAAGGADRDAGLDAEVCHALEVIEAHFGSFAVRLLDNICPVFAFSTLLFDLNHLKIGRAFHEHIAYVVVFGVLQSLPVDAALKHAALNHAREAMIADMRLHCLHDLRRQGVAQQAGGVGQRV